MKGLKQYWKMLWPWLHGHENHQLTIRRYTYSVLVLIILVDPEPWGEVSIPVQGHRDGESLLFHILLSRTLADHHHIIIHTNSHCAVAWCCATTCSVESVDLLTKSQPHHYPFIQPQHSYMILGQNMTGRKCWPVDKITTALSPTHTQQGSCMMLCHNMTGRWCWPVDKILTTLSSTRTFMVQLHDAVSQHDPQKLLTCKVDHHHSTPFTCNCLHGAAPPNLQKLITP